ncbi:MAG TPA: cytochrome P450, partial [Myxococcota bacterium]
DAAWLVRFAFLTAFKTTELAILELLCSGASVSESLRVQSPVARFGRVAVDDLELGGVTIPRGARVILSFAGANHDPRIFASPRAHLERARAHTFAFGGGAHACIGVAPAYAILDAVHEAAAAIGPLVVVERDLLRSHVNRAARRVTVRWRGGGASSGDGPSG